ncbi:MAG: DUF1501 domain-containing protein [Planctomycetes bacterium]|nr:DUF1501 domain-containing protein [Planctomycetota bacterium]
MSRAPQRCAGPITRRSALMFGTAALGGLGMGDFFRLQAQALMSTVAADRAVIFVWMPGGPPHMEMYDLKPNAPSEYRGEFRPINTNVSGMQVGELLPLHAKVADKYNIIRSVAHKFADHGGGHKRFMTGRDPKEPTGFVNDYPAVPSMIAKMVAGRRRGLPNYVCGADNGRQGIDVFSFGSAYLGNSTHPFMVAGNPAAKDFKIENLAPLPALEGRLEDRVALLNQFDNWQRRAEKTGVFDGLDEFNRRALELVTSEKARRAFDLSAEPEAVRERYGQHAYGQRALMARRLVEAGCTFVTMVMENPMPGEQLPNYVSYNWDSHAVNCHLFDDARVRFPRYDQAVTALIEDLYARGLDKRVLLVVTGEFGRTPRLSYQKGTSSGVMQPGRDHWPGAMSMIVSGGGMRTGQVIGATNAKGEYPTERPFTPNDLWATVLAHLGIDREHAFPDHTGRPMPLLPFGEPIAECRAQA